MDYFEQAMGQRTDAERELSGLARMMRHSTFLAEASPGVPYFYDMKARVRVKVSQMLSPQAKILFITEWAGRCLA